MLHSICIAQSKSVQQPLYCAVQNYVTRHPYCAVQKRVTQKLYYAVRVNQSARGTSQQDAVYKCAKHKGHPNLPNETTKQQNTTTHCTIIYLSRNAVSLC